MDPLPNTKNCFACGLSNPGGLQLKMETDGRVVRALFIPRREHAGFSHAVHGGITTTALDEVMAWAIIATTRRPAYSAEFTVRFTRPILLGERTVVTGEVTSNRRNRLFETRGEVRNERGEICASATGKYLALDPGTALTALEDFPPEARDYFTGSSAM
ncbi:MAG TPA: PaaI family thioesterase [Verrucomicrobiales bacterium]|nr:PaaI family thioesterase [Verrucomicrobiales bacterium]